MQGYLTSNTVHYTKDLSSLQYEVNLLTERNKILTLENEQLITKIQQTQQRLTVAQKKLNMFQREHQLSISSKSKEKEQILRLLKLFQQNSHTYDTELVQEMYRNNCPTYSILENLISVIKNSGQNKQNRSNLNRLQKLVNKRKQRMLDILPRNKEIVHIVKQPMRQQTIVNEADLQFIVNSTQKIIRKVKKTEISIEGISNVMDRLINLIYLRKNIRQQERNLNKSEREIQLGVGCRMVFEELTKRLIQMRKEELELKNKIQKLIFQL